MKKSQKTRALLAAGCIAGSACVSGPMARPPPPPEECPPGAAATHKRVDIHLGGMGLIYIQGRKTSDYPTIVVSEGEVTVEVLAGWSQLPDKTPIYGRLYLGAERVYGRFTSARLPGGELVPVCMELVKIGEGLGIAMQPGSTPTKAVIPNQLTLRAVDRFY